MVRKIYDKAVYDIFTGKRVEEVSHKYQGPVSELAAQAWKIYSKAKKIMGSGNLSMAAGGITLGAGVFKMCLLKSSATAIGIGSLSTISTWGSLRSAEIAVQGGYAANGRNLVPATGQWTLSANTCTFKYSTIGLVFTASGAALSAIRFAVIRTSTSATGGKLLCYCSLSSAAFSISSPNTLTILPAATGVFTLV